MEVSVIIPTFNEAGNLSALIRNLKNILESQNISYEIIVVDANSNDNTCQIAKDQGALAFVQNSSGYGGAIKEGVKAAKGKYLIIMDADLSHNPYIIKRLYACRERAHIVIASRYVRGGLANMPFLRLVYSRILNKLSGFILSLPYKDLSSGFRLYNSEIFKEIDITDRDFSVIFEILIKAHCNGFKVLEIPFHYQPRLKGSSHARIVKFGWGYFRTVFKLWGTRNSINSADYDQRAYDSRIPPQRYWQRKRYKIISAFCGCENRVLDVGCGTSKILGALPQAVGMDIKFSKLRYNLELGNLLVNADIKSICFKDGVFDQVICSQVIEHIEKKQVIFDELSRVLKKGGTLIIGTPDYARWSWNAIEWLYKRVIPGGYADEHVSHYSRKELVEKLQALGFKLEAYKYVLGSELICRFVKAS